jgi:p-hydroxybenzoate 3-monooxygenase
MAACWSKRPLSALGAKTGSGIEVAAILAPDAKPVVVQAEMVLGCDGAGSIVARESGFPTFEVNHPFRWLALIAAAPPPVPRTIYGLHLWGFSAFMRRSPSTTRYYLQVSKDVTHNNWPADRVWEELNLRMEAPGHASPLRGDLLERDFLDLRVRVREPMQQGRLFLAGDAAHMVTPTGGKGMNMGILEAIELASALCEHYGNSGSENRLQRYTSVRMPEVWRYEEFSNWMLGLLLPKHALRADGSAAAEEFAFGLRRGRLDRMINDPQFSRSFSQTFAGS